MPLYAKILPRQMLFRHVLMPLPFFLSIAPAPLRLRLPFRLMPSCRQLPLLRRCAADADAAAPPCCFSPPPLPMLLDAFATRRFTLDAAISMIVSRFYGLIRDAFYASSIFFTAFASFRCCRRYAAMMPPRLPRGMRTAQDRAHAPVRVCLC